MIKVGNETLACGLKIIYLQDKSKNRTEARMIINFGNQDAAFKLNNQEYEIKPGTAHLLEHTIIENSSIPNLVNYYQDNDIAFNGMTSNIKTIFYIKTLTNFMKHLPKFLTMINCPVFNDNDLNKTKQAIYNEIQKNQDRTFYFYNKIKTDNIFYSSRMSNILGSREDLQQITSSNLSLVHQVFYQSINQTLCLIGNFDLVKVTKLINDFYVNLNHPLIKYQLINPLITNKIKESKVNVVNDKLNESVEVVYKIDISKMTPVEQVKLTFYLSYFLKSNFGDASLAYQEVKNKKYSVSNFNFCENSFYEKRLLIMSILLETHQIKKVTKLILDTIKHFKLDQEDFYLWQRKVLFNLINRNIFIDEKANTYIDNIVYFDYAKEDTIQDIEHFSLNDYQNTMNSLDFTHYFILTQTKK